MTTPIAQYLFNDNANDEMGTYNGTPTNITYEALPTTLNFNGKAAIFNGTNAYITIPSVFGRTANSQFTTLDWIYITSTSIAGPFWQVGSTAGAGFSVGVGSSRITPAHLGNNIVGLSEGIVWIPTSIAIGTGWHQIGMTYNGSIFSFYKDGTKVYYTGAINYNTPSTATLMGYRNYAGETCYFAGKKANSRFFNTALADAEILSYYQVETLQVSVNTLKIPRRDRFPGAI